MALLAVALLLAGTLLGALLTRDDPPAPAAPPAAGPPAGREPPPPPPGPGQPVTGPPTLEINQPYGDGATSFVVYGRGWTPGARVTVSLDGRASPDRPAVDGAGAFHFVVNQRREFFPDELPRGRHTVEVGTPGGPTQRVSFQVDR